MFKTECTQIVTKQGHRTQHKIHTANPTTATPHITTDIQHKNLQRILKQKLTQQQTSTQKRKTLTHRRT